MKIAIITSGSHSISFILPFYFKAICYSPNYSSFHAIFVYYNTLNISLSFYFCSYKKRERNIICPLSYKSPLLVIRFSVNDPVAPVHLLQQDHPHELMGKCHF